MKEYLSLIESFEKPLLFLFVLRVVLRAGLYFAKRIMNSEPKIKNLPCEENVEHEKENDYYRYVKPSAFE